MFVLTLDQAGYEAETFRELNRWLVKIPVGYDEAKRRSYFLLVILRPGVFGDAELAFCMLEYDIEADTEWTYWSGLEVSAIMGAMQRRVVLQALLRAVRDVLTEEMPARVFICTMDAYAPKKALIKYLRIMEIFRECGYAVDTADAYRGISSWWMTRVGAD